MRFLTLSILVSSPLILAPLLLALAPLPVRAAPEGAAGRYDAFFPFRLGDSWSYDWHLSERGKPPRRLDRTRVFEQTEFVGKGLGYRLVNDDGTYEVFSLADGVLKLHGSSEGGRILSFEPPIVLAAPDMREGEPRTTDNPETGRRFRATLLGLRDVETPLGTLRGCLELRLETEGRELYADARQFFYPGVGMVALRYELHGAERQGPKRSSVEARLRLARLAGIQVARLEDVERLLARETIALPGKDDPSARSILKRAAQMRYTWDQRFPGFKGDFEYLEAGKPPLTGSFEVDRELNVRVTAASEAARAMLRNQISSFVAHRRFKPFDVEYAGAVFKKGETTPAGDVEVLAEGDTMGTRYLLRKSDILSVGRSVGRLRFVATNLARVPTDDARSIVSDYELVYYSNEDGALVSRERSLDSYEKLGEYYLPTGRQVTRNDKDKPPSSFELRLLRLRYF